MSTETQFITNGDICRASTNEAGSITPSVPLGVWSLKYNPERGEFYLQRRSDFELPSEIFGDTMNSISDRIINTFMDRKTATGVMLVGEKGSGKTLTLKYISSICADKYNIPTIIIESSFSGVEFSRFLSLVGPCVVIFDEFEEPSGEGGGEELLSLLDGTHVTNNLYIFTMNSSDSISSYLKNRPGRIFYRVDFSGLDQSVAVDYAKKKLKDPSDSNIADIKKIASSTDKFSFDILQSLVSEMNRYSETASQASRFLNFRLNLFSISANDLTYSISSCSIDSLCDIGVAHVEYDNYIRLYIPITAIIHGAGSEAMVIIESIPFDEIDYSFGGYNQHIRLDMSRIGEDNIILQRRTNSTNRSIMNRNNVRKSPFVINFDELITIDDAPVVLSQPENMSITICDHSMNEKVRLDGKPRYRIDEIDITPHVADVIISTIFDNRVGVEMKLKSIDSINRSEITAGEFLDGMPRG